MPTCITTIIRREDVPGDGNCFYWALSRALKASSLDVGLSDVSVQGVRRHVANLVRTQAKAKALIRELLEMRYAERKTVFETCVKRLLGLDELPDSAYDDVMLTGAYAEALQALIESDIDRVVEDVAKLIEDAGVAGDAPVFWASWLENEVMKNWLAKLDIVLITTSGSMSAPTFLNDMSWQVNAVLKDMKSDQNPQLLTLHTNNSHYTWVSFSRSGSVDAHAFTKLLRKSGAVSVELS